MSANVILILANFYPVQRPNYWPSYWQWIKTQTDRHSLKTFLTNLSCRKPSLYWNVQTDKHALHITISKIQISPYSATLGWLNTSGWNIHAQCNEQAWILMVCLCFSESQAFSNPLWASSWCIHYAVLDKVSSFFFLQISFCSEPDHII